MAIETIRFSDLPSTDQLTDNDEILLQQSQVTRRAKIKDIFKNFFKGIQALGKLVSGSRLPVTDANGNVTYTTMNNINEYVINNALTTLYNTRKFSINGTAGNYRTNYVKLFTVNIGKQYTPVGIFFDVNYHSLDRGGNVRGFITSYTQIIGNPFISTKTDKLINDYKFKYKKITNSDGTLSIELYAPTLTDNYMFYETSVSSNRSIEFSSFNATETVTDMIDIDNEFVTKTDLSHTDTLHTVGSSEGFNTTTFLNYGNRTVYKKDLNYTVININVQTKVAFAANTDIEIFTLPSDYRKTNLSDILQVNTVTTSNHPLTVLYKSSEGKFYINSPSQIGPSEYIRCQFVL